MYFLVLPFPSLPCLPESSPPPCDWSPHSGFSPLLCSEPGFLVTSINLGATGVLEFQPPKVKLLGSSIHPVIFLEPLHFQGALFPRGTTTLEAARVRVLSTCGATSCPPTPAGKVTSPEPLASGPALQSLVAWSSLQVSAVSISITPSRTHSLELHFLVFASCSKPLQGPCAYCRRISLPVQCAGS